MAKLSDLATINPTRKVKKGEFVPFVEMAALPLSGRDISPSAVETRIAKAAGAHFRNGDTLLARITPCLENGKTAQVNVLPDGAIGEGAVSRVNCNTSFELGDFLCQGFFRGLPPQCLARPAVEQAGDVVEHGLAGQ